jgi:membrane-associated phospholipid phosphatase
LARITTSDGLRGGPATTAPLGWPIEPWRSLVWAVAITLLLIVTIDLPAARLMAMLDPELRRWLGALTQLGDSAWYLWPLGIAAIGLAALAPRVGGGRGETAIRSLAALCLFVFAAVAVAGLIAVLLKYGIGRARPRLLDEVGPIAFAPFAFDARYASLPSGHANTLFALATALGFLAPRWRPLLWAWAGWLAFTRVIIGSHHVSDVFLGAWLGILVTYGVRGWFAERRILFAPCPDGRIRLRGRRLWRWLFRHVLAAGTDALLQRRRESTLPAAPRPQLIETLPASPVRGEVEVPRGHTEGEGCPAVSVLVPVKDEAANILPLIEEIHAALAGEPAFEVIYVDDGSSDGTAEQLAAARSRFPQLRCLRHDRSCGQSAALRTALLAARSPIVVTIDGDGQNDPADIPALLALLCDPAAPAHLGMVAGQRRRRRDTGLRRLASRVANRVRQAALRDRSEDTGCGLKALRRVVFVALPYFDHLHRFLPALVLREGYSVRYVDVNHRQRSRGRSKYGIHDRLWVGLVDLLGVMWLQRRRRRPGQIIEM